MIVSPLTGGGNTTLNLLESDLRSGEIFYAAPKDHPLHWLPFPELLPRTCWFNNRFRPVPPARGGRFRLVAYLNDVLILRLNDWLQKEKTIEDIMRCVRDLRIDVLLFCPQNTWIDVTVAPELVERIGLPSVVWFMDDYYKDEQSRRLAGEIWENAHQRFVISESMQEHYSALYGGECEVLNNSVTFPEHYPEPTERQDGRLRIVYAGAMNSYYANSMSAVLRELEGLDDRVEFDIYSPDKLPPELVAKTDIPWRHLPPVPATELGGLLQKYDVLLLLSSFDPEWRVVAETAQAGKMADYLAAGRCILAYGPEYAENVRYLKKYGIGETVTSQVPGALRETVLSLSQNPSHRRKLGEWAYHFGREHRDRGKNSDRLWQALAETYNAWPQVEPKHCSAGGARNLLRRGSLEALNVLNSLKKVVRRVVNGRRNAKD